MSDLLLRSKASLELSQLGLTIVNSEEKDNEVSLKRSQYAFAT